MRSIVFILFFLWFSFSLNAQRDTVLLDKGWIFAIDKQNVGVANQWFMNVLPAAKNVTIPHTWNVEEATQNHYGTAWYQHELTIPKNWSSKNVRLEFGAVNHTSSIYLNGELIHTNVGDGFNKFSVVLNEKLIYGTANVLTISVNNDYGRNKIPFGSSFDWPNDGGIIRPVKLIVSDNPSVNHLLITPSLDLKQNEGKVNVKLVFDHQEKIRVEVVVTEENQPSKQTVFKQVFTPNWSNNTAEMNFSISKVNPWHFDFPNLYRVELRILKGQKVVDRVAANIGFRNFQFIGNKTFLNGERIKLMGVEWTAGSNPNFGFAESDSLIVAMGKLMKNVNCIFSRQHFQQGDVFYDFCDRNGILVQQELPLWGPETPNTDTIKSLAKSQLFSTIQSLYNHPSIFSWGVGNELRGWDDGMKNMLWELMEEARSLDPSRYTAYVSNSLTYSFYNNPNFMPDASAKGDYLMMNEYGGSWWTLPVGKIGLYLDSIHQTYPDKPFFISEFGLCEPNFKGGDKRRIEDLIYHMAIYESKPIVEGAIYFDLTDYRTHYPGTSDTTRFRRRVHGVYDMYGNPKPSMEVLRELSTPVEVQHANSWKSGKLNLLIMGAIGLPEHEVKGYKLYVSDKTDNYLNYKAYDLPFLVPGQQIDFEVDDLFPGNNVITVVRPNGYVATQKRFSWTEEDQ